MLSIIFILLLCLFPILVTEITNDMSKTKHNLSFGALFFYVVMLILGLALVLGVAGCNTTKRINKSLLKSDSTYSDVDNSTLENAETYKADSVVYTGMDSLFGEAGIINDGDSSIIESNSQKVILKKRNGKIGVKAYAKPKAVSINTLKTSTTIKRNDVKQYGSTSSTQKLTNKDIKRKTPFYITAIGIVVVLFIGYMIYRFVKIWFK